MKLPPSVRARLTFWYSLVLASVLVGFGALLYAVVRHNSLHHHDASLRAAAASVISILGRQPDCATLTPDQAGDLGRLDQLVLVHDMGGRGRVFYRSPDLDPSLLPWDEEDFRTLLAQPESFQTLEGASGTLRVYSVRYTTRTGRQGVVRVLDSLGNIRETLASMRWALGLLVPFSLIVAAAGGYWLADRALRPVDEVTRLAREIEATNLGRRLPDPRTNDEVGRLTSTFNQMIDRLEVAFETMRRFTADASHELKTPLTIMRSTIDVALGRERTAEEYRRTLSGLLEEIDRTARIVSDLLLLARADTGSLGLQPVRTRLDGLIRETAETMRPLADARQVALALDGCAPLEVVADERWVRQMFYNLLDNAIRYTHPAGQVRVSLESHGAMAVASIRDTGVGIPEEDQRRVFERFYRVDRARSRDSGGAGLGLSIALLIARSHGGDIRVESRTGEGSVFQVLLPVELCRRTRSNAPSDSATPLATGARVGSSSADSA